MTYFYFGECETIDDVKSRYRELAFKHHPDLGGDTATMQEINAEYADAMRRAIRNEPNEYKATKATESFDSLRQAIEFAVTLPTTIEINIRGFWLWLEGDTRAYKDRIKTFESSDGLRFQYSPKKFAWYFAAIPSANKGREFSFAEIEELYGKQTIRARKNQNALAV